MGAVCQDGEDAAGEANRSGGSPVPAKPKNGRGRLTLHGAKHLSAGLDPLQNSQLSSGKLPLFSGTEHENASRLSERRIEARRRKSPQKFRGLKIDVEIDIY
jgi:hypothetical protein